MSGAERLTDAELEELATLHSRSSISLPEGKSLAAYILERYAVLSPKAARELQKLREMWKRLRKDKSVAATIQLEIDGEILG